jgi:predicted HTH domain antitoxin
MSNAPQVSKETFEQALTEMGHDPNTYRGKKLSLAGMAELYELEEDAILEAIDLRHVCAHYDYHNDEIWVDALDAAHFYFCIRQEAHLYSA